MHQGLGGSIVMPLDVDLPTSIILHIHLQIERHAPRCCKMHTGLDVSSEMCAGLRLFILLMILMIAQEKCVWKSTIEVLLQCTGPLGM